MRIAVHTFGCKLNQTEGQEIIRRLIQQDYRIVSIKERADHYIINACAVTAKAEKEVRQLVNQIKNREPNSLLFVTGCYPPGRNNRKVDLWIKKDRLISKIGRLSKFDTKATKLTKITKITNFTNLTNHTRTRAFVKIQDGCQRFCTYCLVPYLRGKPKSKPIKKVIQEIREKEREGYQEVVLVGVDIGQYQHPNSITLPRPRSGSGYPKMPIRITDLIKEILKQTTIPRLRLSSLWPTTITSELIDLFQNFRFCPHFHLSVQSGSNRILRLMGRNYIKQDVKKIIKRARRKISNLNLTADIIVGFPGETENYFQETYNFLKAIGFLKVHIFKYSARPLTAASHFPRQIPLPIKKERCQKLIKLTEQINRKIRQSFIGHQFPVLFEQMKNGYWTGLTNNYLRVYTKSKGNLNNQIRRVRLEKVWRDGLCGSIIS